MNGSGVGGAGGVGVGVSGVTAAGGVGGGAAPQHSFEETIHRVSL